MALKQCKQQIGEMLPEDESGTDTESEVSSAENDTL